MPAQAAGIGQLLPPHSPQFSPFHHNPQDLYAALAEYYDAPSLSWRTALYHTLRANMQGAAGGRGHHRPHHASKAAAAAAVAAAWGLDVEGGSGGLLPGHVTLRDNVHPNTLGHKASEDPPAAHLPLPCVLCAALPGGAKGGGSSGLAAEGQWLGLQSLGAGPPAVMWLHLADGVHACRQRGSPHWMCECVRPCPPLHPP